MPFQKNTVLCSLACSDCRKAIYFFTPTKPSTIAMVNGIQFACPNYVKMPSEIKGWKFIKNRFYGIHKEESVFLFPACANFERKPVRA